MSDNNRRISDGDDGSLSDLIASAIEKKKTSPEQEHIRSQIPADDGEASLADSIARAKYNKENGIKPAPRPQSNAGGSDMINSPRGQRSSASSTRSFSSDSGTQANDRYAQESSRYDSEEDIYPDDDAEEKKGFGTKVKEFFARHKLELIVAGLVLIILIMLVLVTAIIIFNHYYNRIEEGDNSIIIGSLNDVGDSDTVSNVLDYEDYLKDQLKDYASIMGSEEVYNLLLIGEDLRDTAEESRGNTDVMMLVSINRSTKQITLTSFMRDIYLYIPGYYSGRLNSAYATGGAKLLEDTIEKNFGIKIDNYVIVNFYTFIDIIDTIGGIDAEITEAMVKALRDPMMEQNMYLGNPWEQDLIKEPGTYHLNGNQALGYARIRYGVGDDYGRTARQREVITKMIEKAKGMSLLELKELLDKVTEGENVRWDLEKDEVLSLLYNAFDYYKNYEVQQLQIPATGMFSNQIIRDMDVLCPDFDANTELLQLTIYGKTFIDPAVTSTYYLPPSPSTTTPEPQYVYTTTTPAPQTDVTTVPPVTDPTVTAPTSDVTENTTPSEETTPTVTTTPEEVTTPEVTTPSEIVSSDESPPEDPAVPQGAEAPAA